MAIRAVIFDYGMVLSAPADPAAHAELVEIFGAPAETFEAQYWAHRHAYDRNDLNGETYWHKAAAGAGITLTPTQHKQLIATDTDFWSQLNPPMIDWAQHLQRAGIRLTSAVSRMCSPRSSARTAPSIASQLNSVTASSSDHTSGRSST